MKPLSTRCAARAVATLGLVFTSSGPVLAQYHLFWGDVHGHTSHSDGKGSLDDYFTHAREVASLDFVIVTDHDFGNGPPWRMPRETWTLTQEKADAHTVNGRFVAIAGYEWTSAPKYWTETGTNRSERLFPGPPKFYNHKNVYLPGRVEPLFSSKDPAYHTPDLLAEAVRRHGGLIQNNHPVGDETRDQWEYGTTNSSVIANTEMGADLVHYRGQTHELHWEQAVRAFLNQGGRTGFVGGSDTHDGKSAARTAVLARKLTRAAIFDALRHRRNYAVTHDRIVLDFRINGHVMGNAIAVEGRPRVRVDVQGTDTIQEIVIVRDGAALHTVHPASRSARFEFLDRSFAGASYYYVRVVQANQDEHGNPSRAWSSPIWVRKLK